MFYNITLAMRCTNRKRTSQALRELSVNIFNNGGLIRKLSNEGIIKPYSRFRDTDNTVLTHARYVQVQVDMGDQEFAKVMKLTRESPDFHVVVTQALDNPVGLSKQPHFFPLDTFTRLEEEINWPPQVSADAYEQMEMNWKEFSRTRWSNFLRN